MLTIFVLFFRTMVTASRPITSSASVRPTTTASKPTALRTTPSVSDSASTRPSKVSNTVAAKKGETTLMCLLFSL